MHATHYNVQVESHIARVQCWKRKEAFFLAFHVCVMATSGTWEPRALKKRKEEFNTGSRPATFVPSTSAIGRQIDAEEARKAEAAKAREAAEFKGAADLEDLEDEADGACSAAKKARTDEGGSSSAAGTAATIAAPATAAPAAPAKDPNRDEVAEGAPRLAEHIKSNAKFNKVAAMCFALLDAGRVTRANAAPFFAVLEAAVENPHRLREQQYRTAYRKLFSAAMGKASLFPAWAQPTLQLWEISVLTQLDLFTDDSFQFNRAAKRIRDELTRLPCIYKALEPEGAEKHHLPEGAERTRWADAFFDCVGSAMLQFKYPWSKVSRPAAKTPTAAEVAATDLCDSPPLLVLLATSRPSSVHPARPLTTSMHPASVPRLLQTTCDMLVKSLVDRRQNFSEVQQDELQSWNAQCKGQKVMRQQDHAASKSREQTSFERKEAEWKSADISTSKNGGGGGGGLDGWCAKQSNN